MTRCLFVGFCAPTPKNRRHRTQLTKHPTTRFTDTLVTSFLNSRNTPSGQASKTKLITVERAPAKSPPNKTNLRWPINRKSPRDGLSSSFKIIPFPSSLRFVGIFSRPTETQRHVSTLFPAGGNVNSGRFFCRRGRWPCFFRDHRSRLQKITGRRLFNPFTRQAFHRALRLFQQWF